MGLAPGFHRQLTSLTINHTAATGGGSLFAQLSTHHAEQSFPHWGHGASCRLSCPDLPYLPARLQMAPCARCCSAAPSCGRWRCGACCIMPMPRQPPWRPAAGT